MADRKTLSIQDKPVTRPGAKIEFTEEELHYQRVIHSFVENRGVNDFWWFSDMEILLRRLIDDDLLADTGQTRLTGGLVQKQYKLTEQGTAYIDQWPRS